MYDFLFFSLFFQDFFFFISSFLFSCLLLLFSFSFSFSLVLSLLLHVSFFFFFFFSLSSSLFSLCLLSPCVGGVCVVVCVIVCVCVCGVVCVVWHAENPVCRLKNASVCRFKTSPCMPATRAHAFQPTHGGHRQFCLQRTAHVGLSLGPAGSPKVTTGSCPCSSLRKDREQHVPDSSNHSLYLMKIVKQTVTVGKQRREPAVRWFDLSFAPMKKV